MNIILLIVVYLFTFSWVQANELVIPPTRALYIPEVQKLDEKSLGQWISQSKSFVNSDMLNPNGDMNQRLMQKGGLSDYEGHLLSYYLEVKPLEGTQRVYLALFYSRLHMNKTLIRTSLFQDGGFEFEKNVVPKGHELFLHESLQAARGLNLRGSKIRQMMEQSLAQGIPLWPEELVFYNTILPVLEGRHPEEDFFVIAFNIVGFSLDTLGHEVGHSLYDTLPAYKKVVNEFWSHQVTESDKVKIRKWLSGVYSTEEVIIDEFQAYLLQPKVPAAQSEVLADFVPKYYRALLKALTKKSLPLPFVKSSMCESALN